MNCHHRLPSSHDFSQKFLDAAVLDSILTCFSQTTEGPSIEPVFFTHLGNLGSVEMVIQEEQSHLAACSIEKQGFVASSVGTAMEFYGSRALL